MCHNFYFPFVPLTHVALILEVASWNKKLLTSLVKLLVAFFFSTISLSTHANKIEENNLFLNRKCSFQSVQRVGLHIWASNILNIAFISFLILEWLAFSPYWNELWTMCKPRTPMFNDGFSSALCLFSSKIQKFEIQVKTLS